MPYRQNIEYDLSPRTNSRYIISSHHRRIHGNRNKSRWTISHDEEVECFIFSKNSNWVQDITICWGIKLLNKRLQVVGVNFANKDLKIAKFIDGNGNNVWHGYPADFKNKIQDIPYIDILVIWKNYNYIGKSDVRKIKQQQSCNL